MSHTFGAVAVLVVSVLTVGIGIWGLRFSRTTSDFFVASRTVRPALNASAIGGEYLSAASFLGVAGLVLAFGADMLWYPVGWTAGYLLLLALVAAPLRRSGAYTLPDFAQARLRSRPVRHHHLGPGRGDRLAVPDPPAQGRRLHAQPRHRARQPARRPGRRAGGARQRGHRRDAQRHVRAGLPVLAEADRPAGARRVPAARLVRRRRDVAGGPDVRPARPVGLGRPALGPRARTRSTRRTRS